ncbi:MAG: type II toxin-antitoxin system RelE/ParE family toxin [Candidatus Micrarchaeota archaeon]
MAYEIRWDEKARDFLKTIPRVEAQRIIKRINGIADFPEHYIEALTGINAYKLRAGDYRLIIDLDKTDKIIMVRFIGHRKNIYEKL